jgi:tRNA(fMet)-specific endonuclease VapC
MNADTTWLLDTNIISHANAIFTSMVVECELVFGAQKSGSESLSEKIETLLQFVRPKAMDSAVAKHYANIRSYLESSGTPIGPNDTLIAAHALALNATLVSADTEFLRVPGLRVENWLTHDQEIQDV